MRGAIMLLTTALGCSLPAAAFAQDDTVAPTTSGETADTTEVGVDDIVVTAERRVSSAQRTPMAITALSGDEVRERQLNSIGDVLQQTPSVIIPNSSKGQAVFIRGIGSTGDAQEGGDPAVNLNIDGVYQQQAVVPLASTFDISRVEVLRGPQGTLYGRNSNAGSVNIITSEPVLGRTTGYGSAQIGNFEARRVEGAINVPLGDKVAVRLAGVGNWRDGYYSNGGGSAKGYAFRGKLLIEPIDRLKLTLTGLYAREKGNPASTVAAPLNEGDPYNTVWPAYDGMDGRPFFPPLAQGKAPPHGVQDITFAQVYGQIDYDLGFATLTVLPAYNYVHQYQDTILLPMGAVAQDVTEHARSVETRLASNDSAVRWVVGAYYYDAEDKAVADTKKTLAYDRSDVQSNFPVNIASSYSAQSVAVFGQITVPVTDALRLTGGARYTHDRKTAEFLTQTDFSVYVPGPSYVLKSDVATLKGGFEYDLGERSLLYAQVSTGYKAGGINPNGSAYDPEKITAYEVGVKNRFFDNKVQFNFGGFHYDYQGYQARVILPDPSNTAIGGSLQYINAASLKVYGGEAELTVQPTPADRFSASVAYLHSRGHFVYDGGTVSAPQHFDYTTAPPNSPKWSGNVSYSHRFDFSNGGSLSPRVDLRYSGGYDTSIDASEFDYQAGYTRTDASITYAAADDRYSVRLFVRNIENEAQKAYTVAPPLPFAAIVLTDPRTYGIAFSAKF